jgi:tRNA-modifying protein YgfZ
MTGVGTDSAKAAKDALIGVKLIDRAGIVLTGKERSSWLNGLVTCDLAKLEVGQGAYGLLVEKKGRIQTDFFIVTSKDREKLLLTAPRDLLESVLTTLDHYLIMEDVELEKAADDLEMWLLVGPKAASVAANLGDATFAGSIVRMTDIALVAGAGSSLAAPLAEAIAKEGGAIVDDSAWNALRIERGLPRFGFDFDASLYPQEAALESFAVSFDKGCYLGQEVVYMLENRGHVKRKLVALDLDGDGPVDQGSPVMTTEGAQVGDVKSSVLGPITQKPVAIAMVKWAQSKPGTELRIHDRMARVREKSSI